MRRADRQGLIRLIHVAKKDLQLDDETYRSILMRIGKKDSSSNLTVPELEKVLEYLKRSGFKVRSKPKSDAKAKAKPSRPLAQDLESKKVRALWLFLHQLGAVKNPSEEALAAYVKRMVGVDALQWISGEQSETLIEALKKWAMRFLPAAVEKLVEQVRSSGINLTDMEAGQLNSQLSTAFQRRTYDPMYWAWESLTHILNKPRGKA